MLVLASASVLVVVVMFNGGRLTPFILTLATLAPIAIGHAALDATLPAAQTGRAFLISLALLALGYLTQATRHHPREDPASTESPQVANGVRRSLILALAFVGGLTAYHFIKVGLPIFSPTIEVDRFNFTGSGLFGLPGRAFLFGLPILAVGCVFATRRWSKVPGIAHVLVAVVALVALSRLASGFKSGLLEAVVILFFAAATTGRGLSIGDALRRYLCPAVIALFFAIQVSQSYATLAGLGRAGAIQALLQRATGQAALPGHIVMQPNPPLAIHPSNTMTNDLLYFVGRYTRAADDGRFSFSQVVAASIFRVPLSTPRLAPVTIGAFPQLHYDFGAIAYPIVLLLGVGYGRLERMALTAQTLARYLIALSGIFILHDYITKGNAIYVLLNWGAMLALLLSIVLVSDLRMRVWARTDIMPWAPNKSHMMGPVKQVAAREHHRFNARKPLDVAFELAEERADIPKPRPGYSYGRIKDQ